MYTAILQISHYKKKTFSASDPTEYITEDQVKEFYVTWVKRQKDTEKKKNGRR
jgi:hypothetical protein